MKIGIANLFFIFMLFLNSIQSSEELFSCFGGMCKSRSPFTRKSSRKYPIDDKVVYVQETNNNKILSPNEGQPYVIHPSEFLLLSGGPIEHTQTPNHISTSQSVSRATKQNNLVPKKLIF
ncbi:uncharacterized protein LOC117171269 [Belonocnema kinseyi]|uniref:uncharacterized protein LOC117171269 n=1 Tax=Belonocnema kinseyi TaxID=2817044 RepID=UPI00143DD587|nr:uncharacterized protein LOC117171269 [Belonocnema kinseyi]